MGGTLKGAPPCTPGAKSSWPASFPRESAPSPTLRKRPTPLLAAICTTPGVCSTALICVASNRWQAALVGPFPPKSRRRPQPSAWIKTPFRSDWLSDPLALDCAFQLMILWSFERFSAGSLPCFAGRYRQYQDRFPRDGVQVVIRVTAEREHGATADMEFLDRQSGKLVARLEGYECVIDHSLTHAFQRNQLPQTGTGAQRAA